MSKACVGAPTSAMRKRWRASTNRNCNSYRLNQYNLTGWHPWDKIVQWTINPGILMDKQLQKAFEIANYMETLASQKQVLKEEY